MKEIINLETVYPPANLHQTQAVSYLQFKYVDDNKLDKTGRTVTGSINMPGKKIIGFENDLPIVNVNRSQEASYNQVKSDYDTVVKTTGDAMTGNLTLSNNAEITGLSTNSSPANNTDAVSYAELKGSLTPYLKRWWFNDGKH